MKHRHLFWAHPIRRSLFLGGAVLVLVFLALRTTRSFDILLPPSVTTEQRIQELPTSPVIGALFSPDGMSILTVSLDGTGQLRDRNGQWLITLNGGHLWYPVFSPDGRYIVGARDYQVALWDANGQLLATAFPQIYFAAKPIFSPDSKHILTLSGNRNDAQLWDTDLNLRATLTVGTATIENTVFSPDGSKILISSSDHITRLWDMNGEVLLTLKGYTETVNPVFSPDGSRILTASQNIIWMWDTHGQPLQTLNGHTNTIAHMAFSPDGMYILTTSYGDTARLWDRNGKFLTILGSAKNWVASAVFSPDGTRILTVSREAIGQLWDTSGRLLTTLEGLTNSNMALSPDESHIFTTLVDGTGQLWDINGKLRATFKGHTSFIESALFSADGSRIITRGAYPDRTTRLWDASGQSLAMFE